MGRIALNKLTPEMRERFLDELRDVPNVSRACREAEVSRECVYNIRERDPEFALAWDDAIKAGVEKMEEEAHRRAFKGYKGRPVTHNGEIVAEMTEYSDSLAQFLLRAHDPEKYRERVDVQVGGDIAIALVEARRRSGSGG